MHLRNIFVLLGTSALLYACDSSTPSNDINANDGNITASLISNDLRNPTANTSACNSRQVFPIVSATSSTHSESYTASRVIDNNLSTDSRWSASGNGQSITLNLGEIRTVDRMSTAWYKADERTAYFDVETSVDGNQWTSVLDYGEVTGTEGFIATDLATSRAQYVKIIGRGNSASSWNSLIEVQVSGCNDIVTLPPQSCTNLHNIKINTATSNNSYDGSYSPDRVIDNNLDTASRWSSDGSGHSVTLDLGAVSTVREISTAWFKADIRQAFFDVQTSTDNANWTTVLNQATAQGTQAMLNFDVEDSNARYVKIVGLGNSASTWNSLIEVDVLGCGITDTNIPVDPPVDTSNSIALIKSLFDLEGGTNNLSPYRSDNSLVFDALAARHVTTNGNGWRHELKMATSNRKNMSDTSESFKATVTPEMSTGSKTIVAQYHGGGLGTLVKVYVSDNNESRHIDSTANNGIFDVYVRLKPEGSSTEVIVNLGTIVSGQSFDLEVTNRRGTVTVSGMGVTRTMSVADSNEAYFKFGNYLQAQDASTGTNYKNSSDWPSFYSSRNITKSVVTFTNVSYTN